MAARYAQSVFINCPFTSDYQPIFRAMVFCVIDCGFVPRCALEVIDSSENRLQKIERIIEQCKFGVHDLSNMELDRGTKLPRFNMPLELGLFLGAKRFGDDRQKEKRAVILDREKFRYMKSISDISGQDIECHSGQPAEAIRCVRNWLHSASKRSKILSGKNISDRYAKFEKSLPRICKQLGLTSGELTFKDLVATISEWQIQNAVAKGV